MPRFWPTLALLCVALTGCGGQQIQGAWRGSLPWTEAEDCRIRLYGGGTFDLSCLGREEWLGAGRYRWDGRTLRMEFEIATRRGEPLARIPPALEWQVEGRGNRLHLTPTDRRSPETEWRRVEIR
jgi:hypothetical protein